MLNLQKKDKNFISHFYFFFKFKERRKLVFSYFVEKILKIEVFAKSNGQYCNNFKLSSNTSKK